MTCVILYVEVRVYCYDNIKGHVYNVMIVVRAYYYNVIIHYSKGHMIFITITVTITISITITITIAITITISISMPIYDIA